MTAPLTDLLKGLSKQKRAGVRSHFRRHDPDAVFASERAFAARWTAACDTVFAAVRQGLTSAPALVLPDHAKHSTLVSDACQSPPAVGAVVLQDGHPVSYVSRKLLGPELTCSDLDIEILAVLCTLREWYCYLEGAQFTVVTDH